MPASGWPGCTPPQAYPAIDAMLARIQNDLFDLGADLATPDDGKPLGYEPLRIVASQVAGLETDIDALNAALAAAALLRPAGRLAGCGRAASGPHRRPARRAAAWWRSAQTGASTSIREALQIHQPALGLPVRRRPGGQ